MSSKPLWLKAVLRVERAVGKPVEAAVRSDTYFEIVTKATRATGKVKRTVSGASTKVLHKANLPAGSDMQRMREQLLRMERRLNRLTEGIEELDGAAPKQSVPAKSKAANRKPANRKPANRTPANRTPANRTPVD